MYRIAFFALLSSGCIAASAGVCGCKRSSGTIPAGTLELRILASRSQDTPNDFDAMVREFADKGPEDSSHPDYAWYEIEDGVNAHADPDLVTAEWQQHRYVLASTAEDRVLDRRTIWQVEQFELVRDESRGGTMLVFELDEAGGAQLEALTKTHLQRTIGMFVLDKLVSNATIMDVISERVAVTGQPVSMTELHRKLVQVAQAP